MSSNKFGTSAIGGLNAEMAPHLLQDHELQKSINGATEKAGQWSPSKEAIGQYTGTAIKPGCFGRMNGEDHLVWLDGNTLYDNDVNVGTIGTGGGVDDTKIIPIGGGFLIMGARPSKTWFYDENHLRYLGAWQGDLDNDNTNSFHTTYATTGVGITSVALGSSTTFTTAAHDLIDGDRVYLSGMTGLGEMEGKLFSVYGTPADSTHFVVNVNSTDFTAHTASTGDVYKNACGVEGDYSYVCSCIMELSDGTILESDIYPVYQWAYAHYYGSDSLSRSPISIITLAETTGIILNLYAKWYSSVVGTDYIYYVDGTQETDFKPGIRLYRTMSDGPAYYLVREFSGDDYLENAVEIDVSDITEGATTTVTTTAAHNLSEGDRVYLTDLTGLDEMDDRAFTVYGTPADSTHFVINENSSAYVAYTSGGTLYYCSVQYKEDGDESFYYVAGADPGDGTADDQRYHDTAHDNDLGAAYTYEQGTRRNPPDAREAAVLGSRLLLNDKDNPEYLWISNVDSKDHFGATDYVVMPDTITGFGVVRNTVVVLMPSGIAQFAMSYGLPEIKTVDGALGTTYGDAICSTKDGVLFARDDGTYLFDGITTAKISNKAYLGDALGTPQAICESGDKLLIHGSDASYTAEKIGGKYEWHEVELEDYGFISADSSGNFYGFGTTQVDKLFSGSYADGKLWTKMFGDSGTYSPVKLLVDIEGAGTLHARVIGNMNEESLRRDCSGTRSGRRIVELSLPRPKGEYFYIEMETTGDLKVSGFWIEVER